MDLHLFKTWGPVPSETSDHGWHGRPRCVLLIGAVQRDFGAAGHLVRPALANPHTPGTTRLPPPEREEDENESGTCSSDPGWPARWHKSSCFARSQCGPHKLLNEVEAARSDGASDWMMRGYASEERRSLAEQFPMWQRKMHEGQIW